MLAVGADSDQTVEVGAEDLGVAIFETANDGGVRMAITVFEAGRNDGKRRANRVQEILSGRRTRSVVRDLEHVRGPNFPRLEHFALDGPLDVAGEEETPGAIGEPHDQ